MDAGLLACVFFFVFFFFFFFFVFFFFPGAGNGASPSFYFAVGSEPSSWRIAGAGLGFKF